MDHALGELYDELAPAVRGFFRARGVRDADDLTGDVFVKVAEGLGRFRGDRAALRRWVFTIAHHRLVDHYRITGRRQTASTADLPESAVPAVELPDPELLAALGDLTEEQREVVVLRFVVDLPVRDVAKVLGKRAGAVKMLQARALEALGARLDEESR